MSGLQLLRREGVTGDLTRWTITASGGGSEAEEYTSKYLAKEMNVRVCGHLRATFDLFWPLLAAFGNF